MVVSHAASFKTSLSLMIKGKFMTGKRPVASKTATSRKMDNLKRIHGIGPITEKQFHNAGIYTFKKIAALSPDEIVALIPGLSVSQVRKQDWVKQARKLAPVKARSVHKKEAAIPISRQHYENFTFEFLLNERNKIHRIRTVHVQSGDVDTWPDWNTERLIAFLAWHTGACLSETGTAIPSNLIKRQSPFPVTLPSQPSKVNERIEAVNHPLPVDNAPIASISSQTPSIPSSSSIPNRPALIEWNTLLANTNRPIREVSKESAFDVELIIDLANTGLPNDSQVNIFSKLYAKKLGGKCRELVNETQNTLPYCKTVKLAIHNLTLPQGLYRLEALLNLAPIDDAILKKPAMEVIFQGGLLQVY